jgi:hypothetical protein
MSTQEFEKDLKETFQNHRTEIADNGFSERVMQHLPVRSRTYWIVSIFTIIGVTITFLLDGIDNLITLFNRLLAYFTKIDFPFINLTSIAIFVIALVLLIFFIDYEESTV